MIQDIPKLMKQFLRTLTLALISIVVFSACNKKNEPGDLGIEGKYFSSTATNNHIIETESFNFIAGTVRYSHYSETTETKEQRTRTLTGTYTYDVQRKLYVLQLDKEVIREGVIPKIAQKINLTWTLTISSDGQTISVSGKDDKGPSSYRLALSAPTNL